MEESAETSYQYAFLDSGSGGFPYLAQLKAHASEASCVYVADVAHFPYGEKTRDEVIAFSCATVERLLSRFKPECVVVACNTISVAALPTLRERFDVPFVGTVPAIKLAASRSGKRKIGLLATERTVRDPYTDDLIARFASDCEITRIGDSALIARIERELVTAPRETRLAAVRPTIDRFRAAGVDTVVLACTHFLHLSEEFREVASPDIEIIDSREGVAQQALRLVPPRELEHREGACFVTAILSPEMEALYRTYARLFGISWKGVL